MKKTFSNVCRCRARTSQLPNLQQVDDNRSVCVVRLFVYPFGHIYIHTGVGLRTLSILCRLGNAKACCALRMDERADTYAIFVYMKGTQLSFYLDYYPGYRDESTMKATIKREQCQTRLNIAEREWVRPKVKIQRHESLGIYIFAKPKNQRERDYNERMTEKAEALRCRRYESIVNERYDFFDIRASLPNGEAV